MSDKLVSLRPIELEDLPFLLSLANDPVVRANVVGWDWPMSLAGQRRWFEGGIDTATTRRFIVQDTGERPLGLTGLWDIDWRNRNAMSALKLGGVEHVRGLGYGAAAIEALVDFAFNDVGLHRLHSTVLETNDASLAAYVRKSGWTVEGRLRQHVWREGRYLDLVQIGILRDERAQRSALAVSV